MHKVTMIGNLGGDGDARYMPDGSMVVNFSVAVNESWFDKKIDDWRKTTTWYRCEVWGKQAEGLNKRGKLVKGAQVYIEGKMKPARIYDVNGESRCDLEVRCSYVKGLSGGESQQQQPIEDDDIPF
jgi:single-strand DNA-binding protein